MLSETAEASKGMKLINTGSKIAKTVPVVFAALNVVLAVAEYQEDTAGQLEVQFRHSPFPSDGASPASDDGGKPGDGQVPHAWCNRIELAAK